MSFIILEGFEPTANDPGQLIATSKFGAKHAMQGVSTSVVHHELHEGNTFFYSERFALGAAGEKELLFQAPSNGEAHLRIVVKGTGEFTTDLYEGGSGAVGAEQTTFNRKRFSVKTPVSKIYAVGSRTGGTIIDSDLGGSGNNTGGETRSENEWDADTSQIYRLLVTSVGAGNTLVAKFTWYEPDEIF